MKKKIINGLLFAVALVAATSSFVSCKDYEGDNYAELQEKYATLEKIFNTQVQLMKDYVLTTQYNKDLTGNPDVAYDLAMGCIQDRLKDLEEDTTALAERINANNIAIQEAKALASKADSLADENSKMLQKMIVAWGDSLDEAIGKVAEVLATVAQDSLKWNTASDIVTANATNWDSAYNVIKANSEEWNRAVGVADSAYNFIHNNYKGEFKNLQELIDAYKAADEALQEQIDDLKADVEKILKALRTEITGITVQAAVNPIFGSFAYPIDVQSNVLAAYYGEAARGGYDFPVGEENASSYWANGTSAIYRSELDEINPENVYHVVKGDILMNEDAGNAGKLYVTVNPSNVDFDGKFFTLRTSDNQVSKVTLSALEPCTEQLKWGSQRASANGFYVANATMDRKAVKAVTLSLDMDKSQINNNVKNIMSDWSKTGVADVAKLALTVVSGMKADVPRLGVQAQWQDATTGDWKNYVSKYDLAAFSVKPLGFDFLIDKDYSEGIVTLKDKLTAKEKAFSQELVNMIKGIVNVKLGLPESDGNIKTVGDKVYMVVPTMTANVGVSVTIGGKEDRYIIIKEGDIDKENHIPAENIYLPVITETASGSANVNGTEIDITSLFNAITKGLEGAIGGVDGIGDKVEQILNKIINIENKIFNKVASVAKNPNRFLQPALIIESKTGYFYPSRTDLAPTKVKVEKGSVLKLYPTTLTGETVIPAFKKYVAVCGAWDAKDRNKAYSPKKFNTDESYMNKVIDGSMFNLQKPFEYKIPENTPAGTVLEIIYECLDYTGKVAGKKYYIEVAY